MMPGASGLASAGDLTKASVGGFKLREAMRGDPQSARG